jgi:hypothetical protein
MHSRMLSRSFLLCQIFSREMGFEASYYCGIVMRALSSFAYCSHQYYRFGKCISLVLNINYITISLQMSQYMILMV